MDYNSRKQYNESWRAAMNIEKVTSLTTPSGSGSNYISLKALAALKGLNPQTERSNAPDKWLSEERESWD
jgi:hypothetical protein